MSARAHVCVFHGRVTKLQEEMGRDKNGGLTQAELSDWIKRSAWQPGRLALAHCSCHPLATHLAHKTLAQLAGPGYSLYGSQATCGSSALYLHRPKIFPSFAKIKYPHLEHLRWAGRQSLQVDAGAAAAALAAKKCLQTNSGAAAVAEQNNRYSMAELSRLERECVSRVRGWKDEVRQVYLRFNSKSIKVKLCTIYPTNTNKVIKCFLC